MAICHDCTVQCFSCICVFALLLSKSFSKKTDTYYMDGDDCDERKLLGGATVYSHYDAESERYRHNVECRITFKAQNDDWKLMMRIVELDIPDKTFNDLCNDALYVYDANTIVGRAVKQAGGNGGLCGQQLPQVIYSAGPYLTLYFRTDGSGPRGKGFKLIVTAYSEDFAKFNTCGSLFQCDTKKCIDQELTCDSVDNCGDYSDESQYKGAKCGKEDGNVIDKFLSLGVTASIAITVGSVVIFIVCVVCIVCCCCRCMRKRNQDPGGPGTTTTTTATSVTINNGGPPMPMPAYAPYNGGYTQQGYFPMQQVHPHGVQAVTYSPFPHRESYSQGSQYSSQPPPSYHRSYTPTSSRSGRSQRSGESVKFNAEKDKVALPVHV